MDDKNSFVLYMDLLSVLDELDTEETAMLFRAIRAYIQLESTNEAIRTKAAEDLEVMTANKTVRIAFAPIRKRLDADNKSYSEKLKQNRNNGKKGGNPNFAKGKTNPYYAKKDNPDITEDNRTVMGVISEDNQLSANITEITEDKAICNDMICYDMINNNSVTAVADNAHARETENRKFLTEFFSENKREQIETLCMQLFVSPEKLRQAAESIIAEWELTGDTHADYTEWARHLINHLRVKIRAENKLNNNGNGNNRPYNREDIRDAERKRRFDEYAAVAAEFRRQSDADEALRFKG